MTPVDLRMPAAVGDLVIIDAGVPEFGNRGVEAGIAHCLNPS
jgi:acyl-CoA hydrolase